MVFASVVSPSADPRKYTGAHSSFRERTVGERILDFVSCDTAGELAGVLKGLTGVDMDGNGSLGYFNAKADWNMDIMSSAHAPPSARQFQRAGVHPNVGCAPMRDIVHHQSPTSTPPPSPPLPTRDFEGVGAGATASQRTESAENIEGNAEERLVMTNRTARARRLFRSRRAASLRRGLRKSRRVRLLVAIVSV
jgi:hypothetical protein